MAEQAYAYVTLIPVAKGFQSAIQKELGGVGGVGTTVGQQTGGNFSNGFKKAIGGVAIAAAAGIAAAGVATGKFLGDSITSASNLGESVNAVNKAYGDFAADVLALGDGVASRLGLSTVDFNAAAVRFSAFAETIAGDSGNVAGVVDSLTTRAADFASVFNIDVSEALQVFQSGLAGEAEPLKRFGINLLDSEVKAYAYANGIAEVGSQLTESEKVQARYGLLLESTAKTAGDFADTSDGLANSQRILRATMENLRAEVGTGLLPGMENLSAAMVPIANYIFPKIAEVINTKIGPAFENATQDFRRFVGLWTSGAINFETVFDDIISAITNFFTGDGLSNAFAAMSDLRYKIFSAIIEVIPAIVEGLVALLPTIIDFIGNVMIPQMLSQMSLLFEQLLTVFGEVMPTIIQAFTNLIPVLVQTIADLAPKLITTLLGMLPLILSAALDLFMALVDAVVTITPQIIQTLVGLLPQLVDSIVSMLPGILAAAIELFTAIVEALPIILPMLITAVLDLLPEIIDALISMLPALIDGAFQLFTGIIMGLQNVIPDLVAATLGLIPQIVTTLLGAIPQLVSAGYEVVSGFARGIIEAAPRLLGNAIRSIGNTLVNGVKDFLGIQSPSKVFYGLGENVGQGLAIGIESQTKLVSAAADALADATLKDYGSDLNMGVGVAGLNGAPSMSMPLGSFSSDSSSAANTVNYYAAPNQSIDSEAALFQAMRRAKVVANW